MYRKRGQEDVSKSRFMLIVGTAVLCLLTFSEIELSSGILDTSPSLTFEQLAAMSLGYANGSDQDNEAVPGRTLALESNGIAHTQSLTALIGDDRKEIKDNVQFLLDFAIVGHSKTGTTSILNWLNAHKQVRLPPRESPWLHQGNPAKLVEELYQLDPDPTVKRGYKSPHDVVDPKVHRILSTYWPHTKLLIGVRHPILWFESFYNYRIREGHTLPAVPDLIGKCSSRRNKGICTNAALFHVHLSYLGKTGFQFVSPQQKQKQFMMLSSNNATDSINATATLVDENENDKDNDNDEYATEAQLLSERTRGADLPVPLPNPVFLFDLEQLGDEDQGRKELFAQDVAHFLDLDSPLPLIGKSPATRKEDHSLLHSVIETMDICTAEYDELRAELLKQAKKASIWIRDYFLESPDVQVSSPEFFRTVVAKWMVDPCIERKAKQQTKRTK